MSQSKPREDIRARVKAYILKVFLAGAEPDELTDSTPLITGGILDSIAMLKLVAFLEEEYDIMLEAHEADIDYLNTVSDIATLVERKLSGP